MVGYSLVSQEINVRAAARPSLPIAPTTTVISNTNVVVTWVAPNNGGSPITAYTVTIRQSDGVTFAAELGSCNGYSPAIVSATTCTIPIATL